MINETGILRSTPLIRNQRGAAHVIFETQLIPTAKTRSARLQVAHLISAEDLSSVLALLLTSVMVHDVRV